MDFNKVIVYVLTILVLILGFGYSLNTYFKKTTLQIVNDIALLEGNVTASEWVTSKNTLNTMQNNWQNTRKKWTIFVDHFEIDNIDAAIERVSSYVDSKDKTMALPEIAVLKKSIKHIYEKEKVNIGNIL